MIGLDTNVLLRAIANDDPVQSPIARRTVQTLSEADPGYINLVVLVEFAWTLRQRLKYDRPQVLHVINRLLESTFFVFAERDAAERALAICLADGFDFPDALLGELNRTTGCSTTLTFDQKSSRMPSFTLAQ